MKSHLQAASTSNTNADRRQLFISEDIQAFFSHKFLKFLVECTAENNFLQQIVFAGSNNTF